MPCLSSEKAMARAPGPEREAGGGPPAAGRDPVYSKNQGFAVPAETAQNFQSALALSVSWPFGDRHREPSKVLESATFVGSTVPSTSDTGLANPGRAAIVI